jgi:hypothetical protein
MSLSLPTPEPAAHNGRLSDLHAPLKAPRRKSLVNPVKIAPYLFIAPFFLLFGLFIAFPLLFSLYLSFQSWDATAGLASMKWVGLSNFIFTLTDPWYWKSLYNTASMAIMSGLPQHLIALPLAFFLQTAFRRWRNFVVGLYFLPYHHVERGDRVDLLVAVLDRLRHDQSRHCGDRQVAGPALDRPRSSDRMAVQPAQRQTGGVAGDLLALCRLEYGALSLRAANHSEGSLRGGEDRRR